MALSKILIIGPTGAIGKHMVTASVKLGHPTFALVRSTTSSDPAKAKLLKSFENTGVTFLIGDTSDHKSLVAALKQVEVVVVTVGGAQLEDQIKIIDAAKEAGTIKRFFPSEFGNNFDRANLDDPVTRAVFGPKLVIRRAVEESGIPYTFVASYCFFSYFLTSLVQDNLTAWEAPPRDGKLIIFGDGNTKAVWNNEADIATFTIRSVDDPRAENKNLLIQANIASLNEVIAVWEKKIGHTFEKEFLSSETILKSMAELPPPKNFSYGLNYSVFVKGEQTLELDPSTEVEATVLYPDVKYTTIDEHFSRFV
ncbi:unnamed protein product [Calypogeia fissa]